MNLGRSVFSQLLDFLPTYHFQLCVDRYQGNRYVKDFSCWDQFLCLMFAQLTYRRSLRDIEACLRAQQPKLYHMGFRGHVSRNTLAHANEVRDWRIYRDFAQVLIRRARDLYYQESFGVDLSETVYAFDSTTIDLCLSLFPWGKFRRRKSAVKLHTLLDVRGTIPTNVYVTGGQVHDVNLLDELLLEPGTFYLLDRGYVDFARLHLFTQACAFFVTRAKKNLQFYLRTSRPVDRSSGLRCDQTIRLTGIRTAKRYPDTLRRIVYFDAEKESRLTFLTNNFLLLPLTIAQLYRVRWQVELFFRWIKQHLRIKAFYGTSENAVKTQVWVALSAYVLVAIAKKQLRLDLSLYQILEILSVTIFEKAPILEGFSNFNDRSPEVEPAIQLSLLDF
ncbi:MAG TPA: IS4 family transposase [Terriglobales bacterium]|nr:IS4 family transposase [Terriglobales bacterium]